MRSQADVDAAEAQESLAARAQVRSQQEMVSWLFRFREMSTGEIRFGKMFEVPAGQKPHGRIVAVWGDIIDWEYGLHDMKLANSD